MASFSNYSSQNVLTEIKDRLNRLESQFDTDIKETTKILFELKENIPNNYLTISEHNRRVLEVEKRFDEIEKNMERQRSNQYSDKQWANEEHLKIREAFSEEARNIRDKMSAMQISVLGAALVIIITTVLVPVILHYTFHI